MWFKSVLAKTGGKTGKRFSLEVTIFYAGNATNSLSVKEFLQRLIPLFQNICHSQPIVLYNEPPHGKTNNLHMRKQINREADQRL